jgi:hypothetical protein
MSLKITGIFCSIFGSIFGSVGFYRGYKATEEYRFRNCKLMCEDKIVLSTLNGIYYAHPLLVPFSIYKMLEKDDKEYFEVFLNTKNRYDK